MGKADRLCSEWDEGCTTDRCCYSTCLTSEVCDVDGLTLQGSKLFDDERSNGKHFCWEWEGGCTEKLCCKASVVVGTCATSGVCSHELSIKGQTLYTEVAEKLCETFGPDGCTQSRCCLGEDDETCETSGVCSVDDWRLRGNKAGKKCPNTGCTIATCCK